MRRPVSIALVVLVGLLVGAGFAVHSKRFEDAVRERIARTLKDELGLILEVDDLELQLLPPGASFRGLALRDADADASWLEAHRGSAVLRPWPSRTGAIVVEELMLDGLAIDTTARRPRATAHPDAHPSLPSAPSAPAQTSAPRAPRVDVRSLRLWNARGHVVTDAVELRFARVDALLEPTETGRTLDVTLPDATIVRAGTTMRLEAHLRGGLEGSLDAPTRIVLESAKLALPRVTATANGSIELTPSVTVALDARASATLAGITGLVPELPELSGDVTADLEVAGPLTDLALRSKAEARGLRVANVLIGDVAAEVSHRAGGLHVAAFEVEHPRAGRLTGSGTVALEGKFPFEASARAHGVVLEELLGLVGLPHAWVRMVVSGDARATGELLALPIHVDADLVGERFAVLDDRFENPNAQRMFGLGKLRARGPLTIGARAVTLDDVTVTSGATSFRVEGTLGLTPREGMNLRAVSARARLDDLSPMGELTLGGRGKAALSAEGPYDDPVVSGTLELDALDLLGVSVGAVKGTLVYRYPTLSFERVALQRGAGSSSGTASIDFSTSPPTLEAHADIEAIPLTAVLEAAHVPEALRNRFTAKLTGNVRASGPANNPHGTVTLETYAVSFDSIAMGEAKLVAGFGDADELVHGRLQMSPRGGVLDMRLALRPQGRISVSGNVAQVPLAFVSPFAGDLALEGTTSGRVELEGPPSQLSGQLSVTFREAKIAGVELATSRLEVRLDKGQGALEGTLLSGAVQATSSFTLAEGVSYLCSATFTDLDAGKLWALPAGVRARGTGTLTARGALARPNSLVADAHMSALELGWNQLSLRATRPARLALGPQGLVVKELQVEGNGMQLDVQGQAPADGSLKLALQGGGSLGVVGLMAPTLGATRGRFDLALRVLGTWSSPVVDGVARLASASVAFRNAPVTLEELEGVVRFAGRSMSIERATGKVGGGAVRMGGQILWDDEGKAELSLRTELDGVQLAPMADLSTTLSGNLTLQGPVGGLDLRGHVRLDSLRYTRNFDLVGLIPTGASPPLRVPALEPSETVELSVKVTAPSNLFIVNNVLEAELGADLLVTGTTNRMGLYGSVTPRWARARFRDTTFELERSSIDFTEEYRVAAQFDLRARAKACGMDVQMSVFGDSQNYTVVPSGQDERGAVDPQDVLTCLNFGLRLRDLENASARGRGTFDTAFPGGLDALWSVSGLDEKVRRVLPIGLDEVRLTSSWSARSKRTEPRLLVGKEVGKNLELKYSRALESTPEGWTDQMLSLEYRLSSIATVEGTWLSVQELPVADFGLDLRLRWEFR